MKRLVISFVLLLAVYSGSWAAAVEIGGVQLPDSATVGGKTLVLNGAGLRTKFFMKIYAGSLYLEKKSHDVKAIISADEPMLVRMHFIYNGVSAQKLKNAWKDGFELTAPEATGTLKEGVSAFVALFSDEAMKNDVYTLSWMPDHGVDVTRNNEPLGTIQGLDFKKALFAIWFGEDPVDEGLKEGMVGE